MKRTILIIGLATVGLTGCGREQTVEQTPKIIPVKVMTVGLSDGATGRDYVGTVEASTAVSVGFAGMGVVERVWVTEGERVSKGRLLAVLNGSAAQNAYDAAKSTLHQAQDAYSRLKPLHEKGSLTDIKLIEVETGLEQAKAMEAIARKSLEDCSLYAPLSGIISKRSVEEGVNVLPGVSAFKLVSIEEVDVKVSIPENEISDIRTGQVATVTVPALDNAEYQGIVSKKGVEGNPVSRTYDVRIRVKNPQSEVMPGMVCKVLVQNGLDGGISRIVIPNRTVQIAHDGKRFVWIAENGAARRRFITTGGLSALGVDIESGLTGGEQLITEGYQKVSEGMSVSIL